MKTAALALLLGAAPLAVGLACDGGEPEDTLTLEGYFAQMDSLRESSDADYGAVHAVREEQARRVPETGVSLVVLQRERIRGLVEVMNAIGTELGEIAVPDQARPAHNAYAAALNNYAGAMEVYAATDSDQGLREPIARLLEACSDLQTIAEETSVEADLCSDGTVRLVDP